MPLTVQHVDVYPEEHSAGEPVLFLHGVPDSAQMWDGVIEHLESLYRCLAPDLPGAWDVPPLRPTLPAAFRTWPVLSRTCWERSTLPCH